MDKNQERREKAREKSLKRKQGLLVKKIAIRVKRRGVTKPQKYTSRKRSRRQCLKSLLERVPSGINGLVNDEINYYLQRYEMEMGQRAYAITPAGWFIFHVERKKGMNKWTARWDWLEEQLKENQVSKIMILVNFEYIGHKNKGHIAPVVIEKDRDGGPTFQFFSLSKTAEKYWQLIVRKIRSKLPGFKCIPPYSFIGRFPVRDGCALFTAYIFERMLANNL